MGRERRTRIMRIAAVLTAAALLFALGCSNDRGLLPGECLVTFVSNGGSKVSEKKLKKGDTITKSPVSVMTGYTFEGWFASEDLSGDPVAFPLTVESSMTLRAGWSKTKNGAVVVNQIFGLGDSDENSDGVSHSFIELYNPTEASVPLDGWSIQFSEGGKSWKKLNLKKSVPAKRSFLIRLTQYSSRSARLQLTKSDMDWPGVALPNKNLKVALMSNTDRLSCVNPFDLGSAAKAEGYVDMLAVTGNDSDEPIDGFEKRAPAGQSKQKALRRVLFADTDDNLADSEIVDYREADLETYRPRTASEPHTNVPSEVIPTLAGGMYPKSQTLRFDGLADGAELRYTLNGEDPTAYSLLYDSKYGIAIDDRSGNWRDMPMSSRVYGNVRPTGQANLLRGTTVCARPFRNGRPIGDAVTQTYLVASDINARYRTPVVCVTANPSEFHNMYTNHLTEIESTFNYEYFDYSEGGYGEALFNAPGSTKISGVGSSGYAQKSLSVNLAKAPLDTNVKEPVFPGVSNFKRFKLRNGGNMFVGDHFKDSYIHREAGELGLPYCETKTVTVFVNGEYWGFMNMREAYNKDYAKTHFGTSKGNFAQMKTVYYRLNDQYQTPIFSHAVDDGDETTVQGLYDDFLQFILGANFASGSDYATLTSKYVDIDNLIDYLIVNLYFTNGDWPANNLRMFRAIEPEEGEMNDGRWRFLIHDTDLSATVNAAGKLEPDVIEDCFAYLNNNGLGTPEFCKLFREVFKNASFRSAFRSRAVEVTSSILTESKLRADYRAAADAYVPLLAEFYNRFDIAGQLSFDRNLRLWNVWVDAFLNYLDGRTAKFMALVDQQLNKFQ